MDIKKTQATPEILNARNSRMKNVGENNSDSINISNQAKLLAEVDFYKKMILNKIPDVRADKVSDARERLANGYYTSDKVLESVSKKLSAFLSEEL